MAGAHVITTPITYEHRESITTGAAATTLTIQLPVGNIGRRWKILSFRATNTTAGTATTRAPFLAQTDSGTGVDRIFEYPATAVATDINDVFDPPPTILADTSGRVYLDPVYDAGADNAETFVIVFESVGGLYAPYTNPTP